MRLLGWFADFVADLRAGPARRDEWTDVLDAVELSRRARASIGDHDRPEPPTRLDFPIAGFVGRREPAPLRRRP